MSRLIKELKIIQSSSLHGIQIYPLQDDLMKWEALIDGPEGTPYQNGVFTLSVSIPSRYPFEPPVIQFTTPIYHCNIDAAGRICLDVLKMPPHGQWKPSMNILTLIISIQQLLGDPNPNDPLDVEIAKEYVQQYQLYLQKAKESTKRHAITKNDERNSLKDSSISRSTLTGSSLSLFTGTLHQSHFHSALNDQVRTSTTSSPSLNENLFNLQLEQEHHLKEHILEEHKLNEMEKNYHLKEHKLNDMEKEYHLNEHKLNSMEKEYHLNEHKLNEKEKNHHLNEHKLNEMEKNHHLKEQTQHELNRNQVPSKRDTSPCKSTISLQKKSKLSMLSRKRK